VWPQENRFVIIDSIENNVSVDLSTLPLDGIYYKNEDELNPL
jgi:hypothetical protein